jgi:hypothetical protein
LRALRQRTGEVCQTIADLPSFDAITQRGLAKSCARYHRESATRREPSSFAIGSDIIVCHLGFD